MTSREDAYAEAGRLYGVPPEVAALGPFPPGRTYTLFCWPDKTAEENGVVMETAMRAALNEPGLPVIVEFGEDACPLPGGVTAIGSFRLEVTRRG